MEQIYLNTTEKLYLRIYVGGDLTNADGTVVVTVKDSDGTVLRTENAVAESTGVYYVYSLLSETDAEKELTFEWAFGVNSQPVLKVETVRVITPYASIGDIRAIAPAGTTYDELKHAETFARLVIDAYTGQKFGLRNDVITMHGNDKDTLVLPHRIVQLDELAVNDETLWTLNPAYNDFGRTLDITDTNYGIIAKKYDNVPVWGDSQFGPAWKKDWQYALTGLYGWQEIPEQVTYSAKLLADDYFCKETAWKKRFVEQINASDWRVVFNQKQFQGTGNFFVDSILQDFRSIGMVIV